MGILSWIIFGALVGWIASMITGNDARQGGVGNIVVGIIGAFLGGIISSSLGGVGISGFDLRSFVIALVGAVILLFIVNMFNRRSKV